MQIDDINAINQYFASTGSNTAQAYDIAAVWRVWFDNLSWFEKSTDSKVLDEAKKRRDAFNKANAKTSTSAAKPLSDTGKTKAMSAPQKLTIKQGSTGQNVVEWQNIIGTKADGVFGPNTTALTKKWQERNGLKPDGVVGPKTWEKALMGNNVYAAVASNVAKQADAAKATVKPATAKVPVGTPIAANNGSILRRGSQGQVVADWQKKIGIKQTGLFDEATERATKDWQVKHGLNGDGIVGPATKAAAMMVPNVVAAPPSTASRAVSAVQNNPAVKLVTNAVPVKVKETIKATPGKVKETIVAVTPFKTKPIWMRIAGTFAVGGAALLGIKHIAKLKKS